MKKAIKKISCHGMIHLLLMLILLTGLTGCGGQGPSVTISAAPETIELGQSSILTWSSHDADSVSINNGVGTVALRGTTVVRPFRTTTYTISAVNVDGKSQSSVTVRVVHSQTVPVIHVKADPISIHPGDSSQLTWSSANAYSLFIDNGIGSVPVNYSMTVNPPVTTTYIFSAIGPGGTATASVTINVITASPFANISANPTSIKPGEISVLEWSYANAHTVTIEPGIGDGTTIKSMEVSPDKTTTYMIKAIGPGGTATARVTVIVSDEPVPLQVHIEADPTQIHSGDPTTLSWKTYNATRVWIEPDIGEVELSGSLTIFPEITTTYVIHAAQNGHESMDSVTVNVISEIPIVIFAADPMTIKRHETATLSWETHNAETIEIDQGIGLVSKSGSIAVTPLETTTYSIIATGPGGVASESVTVNVEDIIRIALGNQHFTKEKAMQIDPLNAYRLSTDLSKNTDRLLPDKTDWSTQIPSVQSQGTTGSGNAWAMAYYLKSFQKRVIEPDIVFSPMHTYILQCRTDTEKPWDLVQTWKVMHQYGCALWSSLPFEDLDGFMDTTEIEAYASFELSETLESEALDYRMGTPVILNDLDQIRFQLTQGPVILAINHFDPAMPELPTNNDNNFLRFSEDPDIGHAVLCLGYDDNVFDTGALKVINSWGKEWAIDGLSWIKYIDAKDIIVTAMAFNDLPNNLKNTNYLNRPEQPINVQATESKGPFVDIQWTHGNARYFQIYRAPASSFSTIHQVYDYECVGMATHSPYRDYPGSDNTYLYAVVAVNELGASDHFNHQNEKSAHIDSGNAIGKALTTPYLSLNKQSGFEITSIDPDTQRFHIFVALNQMGPWQSFGWIRPVDQFDIEWHQDNTWTGYRPYVRVVAESAGKGFSLPSRTVQIESAIEPQKQIATIDKLDAFISDLGTIQLSWTLIGDHVDHLDIWRTHESQTNSIWLKLDSVSAALNTYHDTNAIKGINYQYVVHCVHEGVSGLGYQSSMIQLPLDKPNLRIAHVEYDTGPLMEPFEMELTIENNGNTDIDDYKFIVKAYNWATDEEVICLEDSILNYEDLKHPLMKGENHIFSISFDLPEQLNSGVLFSWFVLVDSAQSIDEAFESDNSYWAQKMCWMELDQ
ncbi:MAG: hypothetical protein OMM_01758 [Candidatus Magnetoglobus multicellularis str. Araruama]|uniref:Peptidase C1A papain C-terminal domain-containing protein n=1 Tax=Candidatus Magnetoglobus multicellularis str. Araruama TaxID=890399 RepID=A0A1V1PC67_9BACT|nr:MAG: hypothetical protein OMM_01758 [Candidatus Magnetoglobus multicellularis str. Araruama]